MTHFTRRATLAAAAVNYTEREGFSRAKRREISMTTTLNAELAEPAENATDGATAFAERPTSGFEDDVRRTQSSQSAQRVQLYVARRL
jgi:hypothetical protein